MSIELISATTDNYPSIQENDIGIFVMGAAANPVLPLGYTEIESHNTAYFDYKVGYKVLDGTESGAIGGSGDFVTIKSLVIFRGLDTDTPILGSEIGFNFGLVWAEVTWTDGGEDYQLIRFGMAETNEVVTPANTTGWTEIEDASFNDRIRAWSKNDLVSDSTAYSDSMQLLAAEDRTVGFSAVLNPMANFVELSPDPNSLTFPTQFSGSSTGSTKTVTVENTGSLTATIVSATLPDGYSLLTELPIILLVGETATLSIKQLIGSVGVASGNLTLTTDSDDEFTVALTGEIREADQPDPKIVFQANLFPVDLLSLNSQTDAASLKQRSVQVFGVSEDLNHGDQITLYGQEAIQVKKAYTTGVLNDYTSTPLMVISID